MRNTTLCEQITSAARILQHSAQDNDTLETEALTTAKRQAEIHNPWFAQREINRMLHSWSDALLDQPALEDYVDRGYGENGKTIAIIAAGNIPMVAFHDIFTALLAGCKVVVKPSSDDTYLLKAVVKLFQQQVPQWQNRVVWTERIDAKEVDALIATGSNNTSRYLEYYFQSIPKIIRKNRTSVAVLDGNETEQDLKNLATDVFAYFGLGCRSVAKMYVPQDFDVQRWFQVLPEFNYLEQHNKYMNNYTYHRAIYLMNKDAYLENGFSTLRETTQLHSPISCLFYERYSDTADLNAHLELAKDQLQCRVGVGGLPFGKAQQPSLTDFADGVDTLAFLQTL